MIKGKEKVLSFIEANETPYWVVYSHGAKNNCLFRSQDQPNYSMTDSLSDLSQKLDLLESGRYVISGKTSPDQTKTFREVAFELLTNGIGAIHSPQNNIGVMSQDAVERMINDAVFKVEHKYEKQRLQDEIDKLKIEAKEYKDNNLETAIAGIIKRLDPYVDPICDRAFGKPANTQIAAVGFNTNNQTTTTTTTMTPSSAMPSTDEEATQRVKAALELWQEKDPSGKMILVIEKIAHICANDPGKYNMYIPMLLS